MFCQYRIWRSIYSNFAAFPETDLDDETCHAHEVYTDETLREIRDHGFNGIWVHAILHHIACAAPFPELSPHVEQHREKLRILIARAEKYGIKVFLYIQPLRAVPLREKQFWEKYGNSIGGSEYPDARALCISTETVRNYLERLAENLVKSCPVSAASCSLRRRNSLRIVTVTGSGKTSCRASHAPAARNGNPPTSYWISFWLSETGSAESRRRSKSSYGPGPGACGDIRRHGGSSWTASRRTSQS